MVKSALYVVACLTAMLVPMLPYRATAPEAKTGFPGWPATFDGRPLTPLEISARERRFAEGFPGYIGRFSDGERELVIRWVAEETRMLHPAADCYRGIGFDVEPRPALVDPSGARWGAFLARRGTETVLVKERIFDDAGGSWSDVSQWYWAALLGRTTGPWWAVTTTELNALR